MTGSASNPESRDSGFALRAPRNDKNRASRPIGRLAGAAVEHLDLLFRHRLVMREGFRLEVALRHVFGQEVAVGILAAHQRGPVPLAYGLLQTGRDIADRQTDPSVVGTVRLRSMEQQPVIKRTLAGFPPHKHPL